MTQDLTDRTSTEPSADPASMVVLVDATSSVEREVIRRWLAQGGATAEVGADLPYVQIDLAADAIEKSLIGRDDNPVVMPVRVAWLPPERDGVRRTKFSDLLFSNPRNPYVLMQKWIVRNAPDRHRVLYGESAKLDSILSRHREADRPETPPALARSVQRAAVVALERAERAVIGDRYKVPRLVAEEIMESTEFRAKLDKIADTEGLDRRTTYQRADSDLREMVASQSPLIADLFSQVMRPMHASAYKITADESGFDELRELNKRYPLVFLPSHRSYVDAFILGEVLSRNDFPPNHLIGGANLSFWPMGPVARRTGAIFIRRTFGDDEVYKASIEEYFAYLLNKRFNMEWYFEGGRTRTGKLRPPRYGLLNYLAAAVHQSRVDDVLLVPVSITFERLNELGPIAREQVGGSKRAEGIGWLANYIHSQQKSTGPVYVRFAPPISARRHLLEAGDHPEPGDDEGYSDMSARIAVAKMAFEVAVAINSVTPVTANALVTLALLGVTDRALTLREVRAVIAPVLDYIHNRGIPRGDLDPLLDHKGLSDVLTELSSAGVVTIYADGDEPVYSIESGQHLIAAFYRNSGVHWFVNRSIIELAILSSAQSGSVTPVRDGWAECERLRDLLKYEFFFEDRATFRNQLAAEMKSIDPGWEEREPTSDELLHMLTSTGLMMAHRTLRSFFEAQLVVAERLALRDPGEILERKELVRECVRVGKQMLLQSRLHGPESVSTELFNTAVKLAENRELFGPGDDDLRARRDEFAGQLRHVRELLELAETLDAANRKALRDAD